MLNVLLSDTGSEMMFCVTVTGGGQDGCFTCNKCQVVSLFGAILLDNNICRLYPSGQTTKEYIKGN